MTKEDKPRLLVIAGPNGSGKTTLTDALRKSHDVGEYINPDEITIDILKNTSHSPSIEELFKANKVAQEISESRRQQALDEKRSLSFETVLSHPSKIDFMKDAKERGYDVSLYFVGTDDPLINVQRVANRVENGGHDVPHDKILTRYDRTMDLLPDAVKVTDKAFIFDNSDDKSPLRGVAEIQDGNKLVYLSEKTPHWIKANLLDKVNDLDNLEPGAGKLKANDFISLNREELLDKYKHDKEIMKAVLVSDLSKKFADEHISGEENKNKFINNATGRLSHMLEHNQPIESPLIKSDKDHDIER